MSNANNEKDEVNNFENVYAFLTINHNQAQTSKRECSSNVVYSGFLLETFVNVVVVIKIEGWTHRNGLIMRNNYKGH